MITEHFKTTNAYKLGFLPGDLVKYNGKTYTVDDLGIGRRSDSKLYLEFTDPSSSYRKITKTPRESKTAVVVDGGPSSYYDPPFKDWVTVNDMVEYYAEKKWLHLSWIFKDILKAITRWGDKQGTSQEYDANKIIYYGCRLLMIISGKKAVRVYLQRLLDDSQFKE